MSYNLPVPATTTMMKAKPRDAIRIGVMEKLEDIFVGWLVCCCLVGVVVVVVG